MIRLATMTSVCPALNLDETIAVMKKYGYKGLEPRVEKGHKQGLELSLSQSERAEIKQRFKEEGLSICCVSTSARMAAWPSERQVENIATLHEYIDFAADLGCPFIRAFGGPGKEKVELRGVVKYTAAGFKEVMKHAAERNVTVLMETHDFWCDTARVRAVAEEVNHENFAVLWDIAHPIRVYEHPIQSFENIGTMTRHLHAHDLKFSQDGEKNTLCLLGEGDIDHSEPLQLLASSEFDGYLSLEVIYKPENKLEPEIVLRQYAEKFHEILLLQTT